MKRRRPNLTLHIIAYDLAGLEVPQIARLLGLHPAYVEKLRASAMYQVQKDLISVNTHRVSVAEVMRLDRGHVVIADQLFLRVDLTKFGGHAWSPMFPLDMDNVSELEGVLADVESPQIEVIPLEEDGENKQVSG